jgi:transcriptional regulator with XRE-family HTH domain
MEFKEESWAQWLNRITDGATQDEVALKVGVSRSTVARWGRRARVAPETIIAIAVAFDADPVGGLLAGKWMTMDQLSREGAAVALRYIPSAMIVAELHERMVSGDQDAAEWALRNPR